jgi:hypothetical protein
MPESECGFTRMHIGSHNDPYAAPRRRNLIGDVENDAPAEQQVNGEMDTKIKLQLQPKLLSLKKHKAPTPATRFSGSPGASAIHHH